MSADLIDVMYRLRNMAGQAADELRPHVERAQSVLDRLDKFAKDTEDAVELVAASDLHPNCSANIPERSGLIRKANP
jgi:hypothetical protein